MPFSVHEPAWYPRSLHAASKRATELIALNYLALFKLPTGLRFFTVYGAWGWPDMALFLFTRAIIEGLLWSSHELPSGNNVDSRSFQFDGVHVFKWLRKTLPRDRQIWPNLPLLNNNFEAQVFQ
jgi:nucleoside-diphosphate-sugar epimerase